MLKADNFCLLTHFRYYDGPKPSPFGADGSTPDVVRASATAISEGTASSLELLLRPIRLGLSRFVSNTCLVYNMRHEIPCGAKNGPRGVTAPD